MRNYGKVLTRLWHNRRFKGLPDDGRIVYLYLLTCEHSNMLGLYRLPEGYAAADLGWDLKRFRNGFETVVKGHLASRDEATETVLVHRQLAHDPLANANVVKGAINELKQFANGSPLVSQLLEEIEQSDEIPHHYKALIEQLRNGFETAPEPLPKQSRIPEPYPDPEPIPEPEPVAGRKSAPTAKAIGVPKSDEVWKSYSNAYFARYQTEPVRNAKVNRNLCDFVDRLGADEAPQVAAFYVGHNNAYYVRKCHDVGSMLADAEKLRTEWATGRKVTGTTARDAERVSSNGFAQLKDRLNAKTA